MNGPIKNNSIIALDCLSGPGYEIAKLFIQVGAKITIWADLKDEYWLNTNGKTLRDHNSLFGSNYTIMDCVFTDIREIKRSFEITQANMGTPDIIINGIMDVSISNMVVEFLKNLLTRYKKEVIIIDVKRMQ